MGAKVDYQAAAPAETRTPNLHRAKIAQKRVRMEGWRQRRLGSKTRNSQGGRRKTDLTLTGLLMEGVRFPMRRNLWPLGGRLRAEPSLRRRAKKLPSPQFAPFNHRPTVDFLW